MKIRMAFVALLLVGFMPTADAQSKPFMEDTEGDVEMSLGGTPTAPPGDTGQANDLKALYFDEVAEGFRATLELKALAKDVGTLLDQTQYRIYWHYEGIDYAIEIYAYYGLLGEGPFYFGELAEVEREENYEWLSYRAGLDVKVDVEAGRLSVVAPREAIVNALGAPAGAGAIFQDFYVESESSLIGFRIQGGEDGYVMGITDRMPDTGVFGIIEASMGAVQEGDAYLASEAPFRLSNGGATSMVYQVEAYNAGERQTFNLATTKLPKDWVVSLPFDRIVLDAEESKSFPVLVTTPNKHIHGGTEAFLLTMTGQQDKGDVGRLELGVTYPIVPQPAGHHPKLWIHTYSPYGNGIGVAGDALGAPFNEQLQGYMNALEDDPGDLGEPITAWGNTVPGLGSYFNWWVPLVPDLGMGLDFDTKKQAELSIPINYDYIAQDVVLSGGMYLWSESFDRGLRIGTIQPSTPMSWGPGVQTFDVVMDIEEEADFIPYTPNAYLYLEINVQGQFIGVGPFGPGAEAEMMPGATMVLPLNEYHDEVQAFYKAVKSMRFDADFIERPVNPGKTVVFETHLRNLEDTAQPIKLNLTGVNSEWGRILGDKEFTLGAGQERKIAVAVVVPSDATDGGIVDLLLTASNGDDPFKAAVIDLIAVIDTEIEHPDEAGKVSTLDVKGTANKQSPGFEIIAVALGLLAIALVIRKRP